MSEIHKGPARSASKERFWRKHVSDQARSGLTARAYCHVQGLSEHSFYGWRRELSERDNEAKRSSSQFTEVVLTGAASVASSVLQIHLESARIEVFAGCDRSSLEMVLTALRGGAC